MLDALRAIQRERAHEAFFDRAAQAVAAARQAGGVVPPRLVSQAEGHLRLARERLQALEGLEPAEQQRAGRQWLEAAGRAFSLALLLEAGADPALSEPCLAAFHRMAARPFGTAPLAGSDAVMLAHSEEPLLRAGFAGDGAAG